MESSRRPVRRQAKTSRDRGVMAGNRAFAVPAAPIGRRRRHSRPVDQRAGAIRRAPTPPPLPPRGPSTAGRTVQLRRSCYLFARLFVSLSSVLCSSLARTAPRQTSNSTFSHSCAFNSVAADHPPGPTTVVCHAHRTTVFDSFLTPRRVVAPVVVLLLLLVFPHRVGFATRAHVW